MESWLLLLLGVVVGLSVGGVFQVFARWVDAPEPEFRFRDGKRTEDDRFVYVRSRLLNVGDGVARDFVAYAPQGYLLMWDEGVEPSVDDMTRAGSTPRSERPVNGGVVESVPAFRDGDFRWLSFVALTNEVDEREVRMEWRERKRWGRGSRVVRTSFPISAMMVPPL